jgi:tetratricopeptide (TPR) repeat protein
VEWLEQALEALAHLPPDRPTLEQAVDVRYDLSAALVPIGGHAQILVHMRAAEPVAEGLADQRRLGLVCRRIANALWNMQDYEPALAYGQRAHAIGTALGDVALQIWANFDMGRTYSSLGDYRRGMEYLQQNLTALRGQPPDQSFGSRVVLPAPSVQVRVLMIECLIALGKFADGVACGDEACQIAEASARPYDRLAVYSRVGRLHVRQGTLHQAIPVLERAVALHQDTDILAFYHSSAVYLALAYALAGRASDALAMLGQIGGNVRALPQLLACGEAYLRAGGVEEADRLAQRGLENARHRNMRGQEARALWLLGEIALQRDPPDVVPAEAHYQQALALAEELGMRPLVAHCHHGLGRLYCQTGRGEQARAALTAAIDLYRAMDMTFWLPQAETARAKAE